MERVECELIRMELGKVVGSRTFASSARSRELLEYLVRAEVDGRTENLKGYTVAVEALGQPEDFDPSTSSLVRTQMRKLRELLGIYYKSEGHAAPLRFEAPKGGPFIRVVPNRPVKLTAFRALLTLFDGPVRACPHLFKAWVYRASLVATAVHAAGPLMFAGSVTEYPVLVATLLVSPIAYTPAAVMVAYLLTLRSGGRRAGLVEHTVAGAVVGVPYWLTVLTVRWLGAWPVEGMRDALLALLGAVFVSTIVFGTIALGRDDREGPEQTG